MSWRRSAPQAKPDAGHGRIDADDASAGVGQRSARVARVKCGIGLDDVLDEPRCAAVAGAKRPAERADHARRDRTTEAERVADRDHELADLEPAGVAETSGRRVAFGADNGEVREGVTADDAERLLRSVDEGGIPAIDARNDVCRGDEVAVGCEGDCRPDRPRTSRFPGGRLEARDRRDQRLGDGRDRRRVRVEDAAVIDVLRDIERSAGAWVLRWPSAQASPVASPPPTLTVRSSVPRTTFTSKVSPALASTSTSRRRR